MRFTKYGQQRAKEEPLFATEETGATAHMLACGHDAGQVYLLTGRASSGRPFRRQARSVQGAFMMMRAAWGLERAWHVLPDGARKLCIERN